MIVWFMWLLFAMMGFTILYFSIVDPLPRITQQSPVWRDATKQERSTFRLGESAYLHREICSDQDVSVTTARRLESLDGAVSVPLTAGQGRIRKGCNEVIFPLAFPIGVPELHYYYVVNIRPDMVLRRPEIEIKSPPIEVIK
jgi:hypothetical protein